MVIKKIFITLLTLSMSSALTPAAGQSTSEIDNDRCGRYPTSYAGDTGVLRVSLSKVTGINSTPRQESTNVRTIYIKPRSSSDNEETTRSEVGSAQASGMPLSLPRHSEAGGAAAGVGPGRVQRQCPVGKRSADDEIIPTESRSFSDNKTDSSNYITTATFAYWQGTESSPGRAHNDIIQRNPTYRGHGNITPNAPRTFGIYSYRTDTEFDHATAMNAVSPKIAQMLTGFTVVSPDDETGEPLSLVSRIAFKDSLKSTLLEQAATIQFVDDEISITCTTGCPVISFGEFSPATFLVNTSQKIATNFLIKSPSSTLYAFIASSSFWENAKALLEDCLEYRSFLKRVESLIRSALIANKASLTENRLQNVLQELYASIFGTERRLKESIRMALIRIEPTEHSSPKVASPRFEHPAPRRPWYCCPCWPC